MLRLALHEDVGVGWKEGVLVAFWGEISFFFLSFFLASISVLCGMECVFVIFTSYISSGRCIIMENLSLLMCLQCSCVVKTHPRKAALWTQGGTTWQRMWSRFLPSCVQQARGSHVFLHLRRSEQGSRSPSNTDICWNPSPGGISILPHLTPNGHLILCSQSPQSSHTHTAIYSLLPGKGAWGSPLRGVWADRESSVS